MPDNKKPKRVKDMTPDEKAQMLLDNGAKFEYVEAEFKSQGVVFPTATTTSSSTSTGAKPVVSKTQVNQTTVEPTTTGTKPQIANVSMVENFYNTLYKDSPEKDRQSILNNKEIELAVFQNNLGDVPEAKKILTQKYALLERREELLKLAETERNPEKFKSLKKDFDAINDAIGEAQTVFFDWYEDFATNFNTNNKDQKFDFKTKKIVSAKEYDAMSDFNYVSVVKSDVEGSGGVEVVSDQGTRPETKRSLALIGYDGWQSNLAEVEFETQKKTSELYNNILNKSVDLLLGDPTNVSVAENRIILGNFTEVVLNIAEKGSKAGMSYKGDFAKLQQELNAATSAAEKHKIIRNNKAELNKLISDFTALELQQLHETMSPVIGQHAIYFEQGQQDYYNNYGNEPFENISRLKDVYNIVQQQAQIQTVSELKNKMESLHSDPLTYNEAEAMEAFLAAFYAEHYYDDNFQPRSLDQLQKVFQDVYFDEYQEGMYRAAAKQQKAANLINNMYAEENDVLSNVPTGVDEILNYNKSKRTSTFASKQKFREKRKAKFEESRKNQFNDPGAPEIAPQEEQEGGFSLGQGTSQEFLYWPRLSRIPVWGDYEEVDQTIENKEILKSNTIVKLAEYLSSPTPATERYETERLTTIETTSPGLGEMVSAVLKNPSKILEFPVISDANRDLDRIAEFQEDKRKFNIMSEFANDLTSIRPTIYKAYSDVAMDIRKSFNNLDYSSIFPEGIDAVYIGANEFNTGDAALNQAIPVQYENVNPKANYPKSANYKSFVKQIPTMINAEAVNIVQGPLTRRAIIPETKGLHKAKSAGNYQEMLKLSEEADYVDMAYYPMLGNKSTAGYQFTYKKGDDVIGHFTIYGQKAAFENTKEVLSSNFGKSPDLKIMKLNGYTAKELDTPDVKNNKFTLDENQNVIWHYTTFEDGIEKKDTMHMNSFYYYNNTINEVKQAAQQIIKDNYK